MRKREFQRHLAFKQFTDTVCRSQDLLHLRRNFHNRFIQFAADDFFLLLERVVIPRQSTMLLHELITTTGNTVINQLSDFAKRGEIET